MPGRFLSGGRREGMSPHTSPTPRASCSFTHPGSTCVIGSVATALCARLLDYRRDLHPRPRQPTGAGRTGLATAARPRPKAFRRHPIACSAGRRMDGGALAWLILKLIALSWLVGWKRTLCPIVRQTGPFAWVRHSTLRASSIDDPGSGFVRRIGAAPHLRGH